MRRVVPGSGDVGEFGKRGDDHDSCGNRPTKGNCGPSHLWGRRRLVLRRIYFGRVERSVEVVDRDVQDPDTIEVYE